MEEQKIGVEFSLANELPIIENRYELHNYASKLSNKLHYQHPPTKADSQRIKSQYIKLCRKIKLAYGALSREDNPHPRVLNSKKTIKTLIQGCTTTQIDKLIIKDCFIEKFGKTGMKKGIDGGGRFQLVYNVQPNPTISKFQILEINGYNIRNQKDNQRLVTNFTVENVQTREKTRQKTHEKNRQKNDQLKGEIKSKIYYSQPKQLKDKFRSQYLMSIRKKIKKNPQNEQIKQRSRIQIQGKQMKDNGLLPNIKSLSSSQDQQKKKDGTHKENYVKVNRIFKKGTKLINFITPSSYKSVAVRKGKLSCKGTKNTKPFTPNFETYYYRDLLWKVNFSNQMIVQPPLEYQHRLRIFIGKGNNAGLIRGLIKRRIWFAVTDRIQDANLVWTQIKYLPYYGSQSCHNKKQLPKNTVIGSSENKILENGLLTQSQMITFENYFNVNKNIQEKSDQRLQYRNKYFISTFNNIGKIKKSGVLEKAISKDEIDGQKQKIDKISQNSQKLTLSQYPTPTQPETNRISIRTIIKSVTQIKQQKMQNHFINNYVIGNKKALLKTMNSYYKKLDDFVFNYLPYTFHIQKGLQDQNYFKFLRYFNQRGKQLKTDGTEENVWIVKPGEFSNRGNGIKVCKSLEDIKNIIKTKQKNYDGSDRTYIVQAYIQKPLLYNKRKFDLRHYMMITCVNGIIKGYWYRQGYVRTTSSQYTLLTKDSSIHLTNDAVQKMLPQYGRYQKGNKISYQELHSYISRLYGFKNFNFKEIILPKMKKITGDIVRACSGSIDPELRGNNFQIFGMDFMIDFDFNLWLIQVNTNPCLELSCPLLANIIPRMVQNALQLTVDSVYSPPVRYTPKGVHYLKKLQEENKFDLIYDSRVDGIFKENGEAINAKLLNEEEETYEDEGEQWNQDN